jgi:hypothetical protein
MVPDMLLMPPQGICRFIGVIAHESTINIFSTIEADASQLKSMVIKKERGK